jgi:hypothetical protein
MIRIYTSFVHENEGRQVSPTIMIEAEAPAPEESPAG